LSLHFSLHFSLHLPLVISIVTSIVKMLQYFCFAHEKLKKVPSKVAYFSYCSAVLK
jgi:hypothetical protein